MKIIMLLSNPFRPDTRVLKEAISLKQVGYDVTILAWDREAKYKPRETLSGGIQIIRIQNIKSSYGIGTAQLFRLPLFWAICWTYLNQIKPYFVHCHDFDTLPLGLIWGRINHRQVIYDAHEYYADLVLQRLRSLIGKAIYHTIRLTERWCARQANAIITVDDTLGRIYRQLNRRVLVLGHYPPLKFAAQSAPVFQCPELTLLYTGRLSRDRGLLLMADILRALRDLDVPARLLLAGSYIPASEEQTLKNYAPDILKWIEFKGWIGFEQMPEFLIQGDIGMSTLLPEPRYIAALPVKLFEYMAVGLPVVASNFPLIAKVVEECQGGLLVDPLDDPKNIAIQIAKWWQHPEQARSAGARSRQAVLEKYNFEAQVLQLTMLYQALRS